MSAPSEKQNETVEKPLAEPVVHRSADLLQGRNEDWIEHNGKIYRLLLTASGKLHLVK